LIAGLVLTVAWLVAIVGFRIARQSRVTPEHVRRYVQSLDLGQLAGPARARAIHRLAELLNRLSLEDRRRARLGGAWAGWFQQMTEEEKGGFIDATMPTGFRQMLTSFEQLPEQNRRGAVGEAVRRLREAQRAMEAEAGTSPVEETNAPPVLSEALQQKVVKLGLRTYYSESSAQTKAELAPVLEEIQRMMESGRLLRGRAPHD
jgi:hypothetical protein